MFFVSPGSNRVFYTALALWVGSLALGVAGLIYSGIQVDAQTTTPERVLAEHVLTWDAPTENADGSELTDLDGFEVALSATDQDLRAGGTATDLQQVTDGNQVDFDLGPWREGRDEVVSLWVRAYDLSGNRSAWSEPLTVHLDGIPPGVVVNLRLTLRVELEVNQE